MCILYTTISFIRKVKFGNKIYLSEVETKRITGKVVQKHIRYVGNGKTILSSSISNLQIDQVKIYVPLLILNHIAQEIHLPTILGKYGKEILCMVFAYCLDFKISRTVILSKKQEETIACVDRKLPKNL